LANERTLLEQGKDIIQVMLVGELLDASDYLLMRETF
jgi:hypothetical protein